MRLIKMFGLAMLAAVATMAFIGVGSASAQLGSILCLLAAGDQTHCGTGRAPVAVGTSILALKGNATLGISLFLGAVEISCQTEMHGKITSAGGLTTNPQGLIEEVKFTSCSSTSCQHGVTAVAHNLPWLVTGLGSATLGLGTLDVTEDNKKGNPGGLFTCKTLVFGFPVTEVCGYGIKEAKSHIDGHTATARAKLLTSDITLDRVHGGAFCPTTAKWDYNPFLDPETLSIHLL